MQIEDSPPYSQQATTGYYCNQITPTFSYFVPLMCILILSSYIGSSLPTAPTFKFSD